MVVVEILVHSASFLKGNLNGGLRKHPFSTLKPQRVKSGAEGFGLSDRSLSP